MDPSPVKGLVPSWAADLLIGRRMINAHSDSLLTKPAFTRAAAKRRCLLPADGWFEWQRNPDRPGGRPEAGRLRRVCALDVTGPVRHPSLAIGARRGPTTDAIRRRWWCGAGWCAVGW